jgi:hypothetical protein
MFHFIAAKILQYETIARKQRATTGSPRDLSISLAKLPVCSPLQARLEACLREAR